MDHGSEHGLAAASALDRWREDTLRLVLPVLVVLGFPTIISDLLGAFQRRDFTLSSFTDLTYLGLVLLMLLPRLPWRVRAAWMVALLLTLGVTLLVGVGLVGAGRLLVVLAVVLAAFFFDSRTTISLWLIASPAVLLILIGYGVGWIETAPVLRQRVSEMPTLLANALLTILVAAMIGRGILSLVERLTMSLRELAAANAHLERRVAERTTELEAALRSNRFLVAAVNNMPMGMVVCDASQPDTPISFANPAFSMITGYTSEEVIGRNCRFLQGPETAPSASDALRRAIAARQPIAVELLNYRKDGTPFWNALAISPVFGAPGDLIGFVGLQSDITTRKANEALVAQQLRYAQTLADCSRLMLNRGQNLDAYQATLDRVLEMIRAAICADRVTLMRSSVGSSDTERASPSLSVLSTAAKADRSPERQPTPEELLAIDAELRRWQGVSSFNGAVAESFPFHRAFERYLRDVGVRSILIQPLTLGGDQPWGHIIVSDYERDQSWDATTVQLVTTVAEMIVTFSEGWQASQLLQEHETLLREMGRMAHVGGWEYDRDTRALRWSEEVYAIHELAPGSPPPPIEQALAFYASDAQPVIREAMERCIQKGEAWDLELPFVTARGQQRWVRAIGQAIASSDYVHRIRGTFQDISERKEAELALRHTNEALQRRVDELLLLNQISQTLVRWTRLGQVLRQVGLTTARFLGGGEVVFWELDRQKRTLEPIEACPTLVPVRLAEDPLARQLIIEAQPVVTTASSGSGQASGLAAVIGAAGLALPLQSHGRIIGALSIGGRAAQGTLTPQTVSLLQTVASMAATTIENARLFARARQSAVAEERRRLARELHDSVSQALFAASVTADVLPELFELDPDEGRERLEDIRRQTRGALAEMRTLLIELRPEALLTTSLDVLFGHLAASVAAKLRGGVQASLAPLPLLPPEVRIALYRIGQEALANVVKHAKASEVHVRLMAIPAAVSDSTNWSGAITLDIRDDGIGFDPQAAQQGGLGLISMRERAAEIGATITVERPAKGGARIAVRWEGSAQAKEDRDEATVSPDPGDDRR